MKCKHCVYNCKSTGDDISLKTIEKTLDVFIASGFCNRIVLGGGEPTLHPLFADIMDVVEPYHVNYNMITNGTSDKVIYNKLMDSRCYISVSDDIFHDATMRKSWWNNYMKCKINTWNVYDKAINAVTIHPYGRAKKNFNSIKKDVIKQYGKDVTIDDGDWFDTSICIGVHGEINIEWGKDGVPSICIGNVWEGEEALESKKKIIRIFYDESNLVKRIAKEYNFGSNEILDLVVKKWLDPIVVS